jgi:hypothetical protein
MDAKDSFVDWVERCSPMAREFLFENRGKISARMRSFPNQVASFPDSIQGKFTIGNLGVESLDSITAQKH